MTTVISGDTGVSAVQAGAVQQGDLAANVVGVGPAFRAYSAADQPSLAGSAFHIIAINTESFDTNNYFDTSTYRFTPQVAGLYLVQGTLRPAGTSLTSLIVSIFKNGVEHTRGEERSSSAGVAVGILNVAALVEMNGTTDYIDIRGYGVGTTLSFLGGGSALGSLFSAVLVRAA